MAEKHYTDGRPILIDVHCPLCDAEMVWRRGPFGTFWGCSKFPACHGKRSDEDVSDMHDPDYEEPYFGM